MNAVEGWATSELLSLLQVMKSGGTPNTSKDDYYGGEIPFVTIEDMTSTRKYLSNTVKTITAEGLKNSNTWIVPAGSILYSIYATLGVPRINTKPVATNQAILAMINRAEKIDSDYLYYWLEYIRSSVSNLSSQTTQSNLSSGIVKIFSIDYPIDIQEQTKIAEILSCIDTAIEQTEAIIAKQQRIKTGLMQNLLSKGIDEHGNIRSEQTHAFKDSPLGRIPVEWEVKTVGDVVNIIDPNPSHRYPLPCDIGVPIVSTENFSGDNDYNVKFAERVPFEVFEQQKKRCGFAPEDVVFARKGRIGLARFYGLEQKVFSHTVVIIKPNDNSMKPKFILWSVRFQKFFDEIDRRMNSNSGVPTLGVGFIKAIPIIVPLSDEQLRIADVLDKTEQQAEQELKKLAKYKRLKTALMQDLLSGNVRVNPLLSQQ